MGLSKSEIYQITRDAILEGLNEHRPTLNKEDLSRVWPTIDALIKNRRSFYDFNQVINQVCQFLNIERSSEVDALRFLSLSKSQAIDFRRYLERITTGIRDRGGDLKRSRAPAPATIRKKMQLLKTLFRDLISEGLAKYNPFNNTIIPIVSYAKRETEIIPFNRVQDLLNAPGSEAHLKDKSYKYDRDCSKYVRDRALLAVLFGGALRANELLNLKMGDYKLLDDGTLMLILRETKKGIEDHQVIPEWAAVRFLKWIELRKTKQITDSSPIFCNVWRGSNNQGDKISKSNLNIILRYYLDIIGVPSANISAHSARATAISKLFELGIPPADIRIFSRHNSIEMVLRYDKRRKVKERAISSQLEY